MAADNAQTLTEVGRVGPLPVYGRHSNTNVGTDGFPLIAQLVRAFVEVHPSARLGVRVVAVHPPDSGALVTMCCDLSDAGAIAGAHLLVVNQGEDDGAHQLRLSDHDEERVARLFRATATRRRFTYDTATVATTTLTLPPPADAHIVIAFDQSEGRASHATTVNHPIQPLAVTYRLQYRRQLQTLELVPAPGGIFAAYNRMIGYAGGSTQPS
jgi:hypothetical protein